VEIYSVPGSTSATPLASFLQKPPEDPSEELPMMKSDIIQKTPAEYALLRKQREAKQDRFLRECIHEGKRIKKEKKMVTIGFCGIATLSVLAAGIYFGTTAGPHK
jgi:hypothetical protein